MEHYSFHFYNYILFFTTIIALIISIVLWPHRKFRGVRWVIILEIAAAEWAFCTAFDSAAGIISIKQIWAAFGYLGTSLVPPLFFLFAIEYYYGPKRIPKRLQIILSAMVIFTVLMAFTNPLHHWFWTNITIIQGSTIAIFGHSILWWCIYIYDYSLILIALMYLFRMAFKSGSFYTPHNLAIILGSLLPIFGNVLYVIGPNPVPGLDWAPVGFAFSGSIIAFGIIRLKLFQLTPIAQTLLVENMVDSMIIINNDHQIVDINPATTSIFRQNSKQMIGQKINTIFPDSTNLDQYLLSNDYFQTVIEFGDIQPDRKFELRISNLYDHVSQMVGKSLVLRDITEKIKSEEEREKLIKELKEALNQVKTLRGLLPICASCKKIRNDQGYWLDVEKYIQSHSDVDFTHSICPDCIQKYYPEIAEKMKTRQENKTGNQ